jgi:hypothetical protein
MRIEIGREEDGRWIAEVPDLPGVMVYGKTRVGAGVWSCNPALESSTSIARNLGHAIHGSLAM